MWSWHESVPRKLKSGLLEFQPAFPSAPIPIAIGNPSTNFSGFRVGERSAIFFTAEGHESPVGMENDEIAFEVIYEVELHFSEFGVVRRKGRDSIFLAYV